jgi:hypothetical protein
VSSHSNDTSCDEVTHVARRIPHEGVWKLLPFVTRDRTRRNEYRFGLVRRGPTLNQFQIDARVTAGLLVPIRIAHQISQDQRLWLAPEGDIWLARSIAPVQDPKRIRLLAVALPR